MNAIDFLSSDIEFPCDSNEPKLSATPCTKLPEPVDWAFHDYYSTILEKAFTPIKSITDIQHLEPVKEVAPPNYLKDWKHHSVFAVQDKQDDQAVVLVLANTIQPKQEITNHHHHHNNTNLRAALRGALDLVEMDMQKNMHDALLSPPAGNRYFGNNHASSYNRDHYLSWKDDILAETLHVDALDQDLWDDDDIPMGPPSPAYHAINENPIVDSSLPSRISSIMPLSSSTPPSHNITATSVTQSSQPPSTTIIMPASEQNHAVSVIPTPIQSSPTKVSSRSTSPTPLPILLSPSPSSSPSASPPASSSRNTTKPSKPKSWNVWHKVKQATQPFTKQFKNSSSKNAFKRLFQH